MKRRLHLTGWLSLVLLVGMSASVLAATVSGPDNTIKTRTTGMAGGLEVGFLPAETWLTPKEGDLGSASTLVKVNQTTFVVPAGPVGGEEPGLDSDDAGLVHCFGTGANSCEFVKLGPLDGFSKPLAVNGKTVVVQGVGANKQDCEAGKGQFGVGGPSAAADDTLFAVWGLGSQGAKKTTIASNLCFFAHSTEIFRLSDDCIAFTQPGADGVFGAAFDDEIRLVCGLLQTPPAPVMTTIDVGALLTVKIDGSAAGRGVRLSDKLAAFASPGSDGHYANSSAGLTANDGLIILKLGPPSVSWLTIGRIPGNFNGRPIAVNKTALALTGVGPDGEEQGDNFGSPGPANDDEITVVEKLDTVAPTITTYSGFGYVRRLLRLNKGAVVAFEEEGGGHATRSVVPIRAHVIRGIQGVGDDDDNVQQAGEHQDIECLHVKNQELKSVTVTSGGMYHQFDEDVDKTKKDNVGLVLNCNQAVFWTHSPTVDSDRQAFLLTHKLVGPILTPSTTTDGSLWKDPKAVGINDGTVVYTVTVAPGDVKTKGLGVLKAGSGGGTFTDTRLMLPTGAAPPGGCSPAGDWSGWNEASSAQPVRLSGSRAVVLAEGLDCRFGRSQRADDGLIYIGMLDTGSPMTSFVTTGRSCAAPGCKPVALGGSSPDLVVLAGPGASDNMNENTSFSECSRGTPTCPSGQTLSCNRFETPVCIGGGSPTCSSGTPTCSGTQRNVAYCDSGVSPSCSPSTLTCSSGTPVCPAGFTSECPSFARCTAKDDDTLTGVSF